METLNVISIFQANVTTCTGSFLTSDSKYCQTRKMSYLNRHTLSAHSVDSSYASQKPSIELQKVLSLFWKTAENHVEYFTLQCGCDLMALNKIQLLDKPCSLSCFTSKPWHTCFTEA